MLLIYVPTSASKWGATLLFNRKPTPYFHQKKKAFSCPNFVTKQSYQRTIKKNNPAKYDYQDPEPAFIYLGISRIYGLSAITAQWPY